MLKIRAKIVKIAKIVKSEKLAVTGSQTQETSSCQCFATEPWQPDNHQLSQSSIYTASTECLRDITICLSTWGVIFVFSSNFKFKEWLKLWGSVNYTGFIPWTWYWLTCHQTISNYDVILDYAHILFLSEEKKCHQKDWKTQNSSWYSTFAIAKSNNSSN